MASSMNSGTSATAGLKRKRDAGPKFYAVRVGRKPGIYHNWDDCLAQVKGFKDATFKSFTSLNDAESFLRPYLSAPSATSSRTPSKYYAVANGHQPGIYTDWPSAQKQIAGWHKAKHKSFSTYSEAEAYLRQAQASTRADDAPAPKRPKASERTPPASTLPAPGTEPLAADAEDGFDSSLVLDAGSGATRRKTSSEGAATRAEARVDAARDELAVWTDGACRANGRAGARAGVGVWFGPDDPRNVAEALPGARQTNQRAELTALKRALDITPLHRAVRVFSDSAYAIKCVTEWFVAWRRSDWKTSSKKPVENRDIIEEVLARIEEREAVGSRTIFEWCKGHNGELGNEEADRLAVEGALGMGRGRPAAAGERETVGEEL